MNKSSKTRATLGKHHGLADEGSAARTRPISFEEIMQRRKKKESLENVEEGNRVETIQAKSMGDDPFRRGRHHRVSSHCSEKLRSEVNAKDGSRRREEIIYREERLDKHKNKQDHVTDAKRMVEEEGRYTERKMGADRDDTPSMKTKTVQGRERRASKATDEQTHATELVNERASSAKNVPARKRLRSLVVINRPPDENSGKPDDLNKRKHQNGDDTRDRERKNPKKRDLRKMHSVEGSERKEKREQPRPHHRDIREKRRRTRSRDHGQDKNRRTSPSPRAEKAASRHRRDCEEISVSGPKDQVGRNHSGDGGKKVASNGSSNQSRRYTGSKSGLGGYSPRKRREEVPHKAPSPPNLSAEKKSAKWDLVPTETTSMLSGSVIQAAIQTAYSTFSETALAMLNPLTEVSFKTPPAKQNISVDSVQLTESTRRMRRLYIENVPDSVSEKSLIECFNSYMLSSGSNYIQGSQPCISCIINNEKGQALVEFLTPEDASSALSLDGCLFAGSSLKIRRPKDFVETTTGDLDKKEAATNALSETVEDSPNKIFIGGISNAISSEMLMEIVSVFGPLKAYRFANYTNQPCAFLEYMDGSITLKACAGLNGMKLGGNVITVVRALPDASSIMGDNKNPPFYGIPEHAKPLLAKPTNILKLKNVIDPEDLLSISEPEMKEILEDVRLECARFGVIKSINIMDHQISEMTTSKTDAAGEEMNESVICRKDDESKKANHTTDSEEQHTEDGQTRSTGEDKTAEFTVTGHDEDHSTAPKTEQEDHRSDNGKEAAIDELEHKQEVGAVRAVRTRWEPAEREGKPDMESVFEKGCILVEYGRTEASFAAARALQGRLYGNRVVKVEYVSEELYKMRFP
ncbi:PREDICTED: splicing factor U2af large subunit A [Tarenaya hassleriana]|uniref:splicing factor U2af large subunit A n=1 Tax=Tarenaya hassleriana TaxID=28532 RepID=UPI00053C315B|nr:PREDICTED: splicing factor U2af large subunit A [Tarenaya hassleriana]